MLVVRVANGLSEAWYDKDWPMLPEIALLETQRLGAGSRVFDVGAHEGVVAMILGRIVGPDGHVVAVEANHENARIAEINRVRNGMNNVTVLNLAVGDREGTLTFNRSWNGQVDDGTGEWGRIQVQATTIDRLADRFGDPDVIFVDVEGFEAKVLAGARRCLEKGLDCFVEIHLGWGLETFGGSVQEVIDYFAPERYGLWFARDGEKFSPVTDVGSLPLGRFFLVALSKRPS
jgi:FkbM family methyltransferase